MRGDGKFKFRQSLQKVCNKNDPIAYYEQCKQMAKITVWWEAQIHHRKEMVKSKRMQCDMMVVHKVIYSEG